MVRNSLKEFRKSFKFLKGIPLYDPSTVEGEWVEPDDKSPFERIKNEIFKWNRKDYAKQIILAIATLQISHQW